MNDGATAPKILDDIDNFICADCKRVVYAGEQYGAHAMCSQCLEHNFRGDGIGGE